MRPVIFIILTAIASAQSAVPDLALLKVAAENGDRVAQFQYASKIVLTNPKESLAMCLRSAQQGYGPAENWIGDQYAQRSHFAGKDKPSMERLAVRYTSRAAFKGIPEALGRMSRFYEQGMQVRKDLALAYGWCAIALRQAGGPNQLTALTYKGMLDGLISRMTTPDIARGREFENAFRVGSDNFVEIEMLVQQMRLSATFEKDGKKIVMVNQTRFSEGETKSLNVDGEVVNATCRKIEGKTAEFGLGNYQVRLQSR